MPACSTTSSAICPPAAEPTTDVDRIQRRKNNFRGIAAIWKSWVTSTGALTLVCLSPLWLRAIWIPVLAVALELVLYALIRRNNSSKRPDCPLIPHLVTRILLLSAAVMVVILGLHSTGHIGRLFSPEELNIHLPFIPVLIVAPIAALVSLWYNLRGNRYSFCVSCRQRHGTPAERGFLGELYTREGRWETRLLGYSALGGTIVSWTYYLVRYVNVNLNASDKFFLCWLVFVFFIIGVVYMSFRCLGYWQYYSLDVLGSAARAGHSTKVRILLISSDDKLFVVPPATQIDSIYRYGHTYTDTPTAIMMQLRRYVSDSDAREMLMRMVPDIKEPRVRSMYSTESYTDESNIFHFIASLDEADSQAVSAQYPDGRWLTMLELSKLIHSRMTDPLLTAEILRLYTIGMAWKTYDRTGKRLYSIRNYHPAFRLSKAAEWKVDYDDVHWLNVSRINEDKPFYRLRRWWGRHIQGLED